MMLMCYQQLLTTMSITVDNEKVKGVFMCDLKNPNRNATFFLVKTMKKIQVGKGVDLFL